MQNKPSYLSSFRKTGRTVFCFPLDLTAGQLIQAGFTGNLVYWLCPLGMSCKEAANKQSGCSPGKSSEHVSLSMAWVLRGLKDHLVPGICWISAPQ